MEKKLAKMRKDIEVRMKRNTGLMVCAAAFLGLSATNVLPIQLGSEQANGFVAGFQLGLYCCLVLIALASLSKYRKALKDDKALKQLYYQENDERLCHINRQVGKSSMKVTIIAMVIATIVAGYFNYTVFITLLCATVLQAMIQNLLKAYYTNRVSGTDDDAE